MSINRISVGRMTFMFSLYFNFNINVLANIWSSIKFSNVIATKTSTISFLVFGQLLKLHFGQKAIFKIKIRKNAKFYNCHRFEQKRVRVRQYCSVPFIVSSNDLLSEH